MFENKKIYLLFIMAVLLTGFFISLKYNKQAIDSMDMTFVLYSVDNDDFLEAQIINTKLASLAFSPCSTFKVPHAIFALNAKVITDEDNGQLYDEYRYPLKNTAPKSWAQSQDLTSALNYSVVWYFKHIAEKIGENKMRYYLEMIDYGNQDISGGLTQFWLSSSLFITPIQQATVWQKLFTNQFDFQPDEINAVKRRILLEENDNYKIYGKTGACKQLGDKFGGWLVGFVEKGDETYYFTLYQQAESFDRVSQKRIDLVKELLITYNI